MNNERKDETSVYSIGSQDHLVPIRSRHTYFKKRTQITNLQMIILLFLAGSLLIAVLVLAILYARSSMIKICDSEDCMRIAASLKESMNASVNPCDDFYQYACGRWPEEHPIPDSSLTNSWFSERSDRVSRKIRDLLKVNVSAAEVPRAVMQAKTLFTSCMDTRSMNELDLSPLINLLELLDLPIIPAALTNKTANYIEQSAKVKRILGRDIFFGFDLMPDPRNNSRNVLYLGVPEEGSPFPSDKELEGRLQTIRSRLRKLEDLDDESMLDENEEAEFIYMTDVIKQIISNGTVNACTAESEFKTETLTEFVETIYDISSVIYYMIREDKKRNISEEDLSDDDYILVDDLQKLTDEYVTSVNSTLIPKQIWRPFIESVFEQIVTLDLDNKDKVLIDLNYLKVAALILAAAEEEILESYVWWVVVDMVTPHSSQKLRDTWSDYVNKVMQVEIDESQSLHCASAVNQMMGMAVSWLFVDPTFQSSTGYKVREMIEDIREAFVSLVSRTDWMDEPTRSATLEKNRKMSSEIGFPKWLFDEEKLDEYYKGVDLSETKYLENMVQIVRLQWNATWASLRDNNNLDNKLYWTADPTDVNAFHTFHVNQITIPVGILQFPFYELGLEALNYGAIGSILGHELTHGFDNSGRRYDSEGNLRQWWTNETISEYTDRTQCFIDHYNTYYENEIDEYVDGELTLGENIADNGGLREAVVAYARWKARHGQEPLLPGFTELTHEQLLFLAFGHLWCESYTTSSLKWMLEDTHCPGHVRLQAVLRNSKEFSAAWNCPVGSNMNPPKKCHLW